jgi:hypothetical protein
LDTILIFVCGGLEGLAQTYLVHANRASNGEGSVAALASLLRELELTPSPETTAHAMLGDPLVTRVSQMAFALLPLAFRLDRLEDLGRALLIALLGFQSLLVFHSPQYVLWSLPALSFVTSKPLWVAGVLHGIATFWYFPVAKDADLYFQQAVTTVSVIRWIMIGVAIFELIRSSQRQIN